VAPDCAWIHGELKRHRHVTLQSIPDDVSAFLTEPDPSEMEHRQGLRLGVSLPIVCLSPH
jgi:hypothetical protein